jgi:hypothetical protein
VPSVAPFVAPPKEHDVRDTATYHFETRQAALDFCSSCDELGIPAMERNWFAAELPHAVHVLCSGDGLPYGCNELAGSEPASYEVGRCPFAAIAEESLGDARTLARCFASANEPAQLWSCIRFARRAELLPEGCYISGALFDATGVRFDSTSGEFLNDSFAEYCEAADRYLEIHGV